MLLERGGGSGAVVPGEDGVLVVDVRRCDERALYGAIPGSVHLPVEQLPRALAMSIEEWARTFRFPKLRADDALVLLSRGDARARWAAQLCTDAGVEGCLVLREGTQGWRFHSSVKAYAAYQEGQAPPEPEPFEREDPNVDAGEDELSRLGLL